MASRKSCPYGLPKSKSGAAALEPGRPRLSKLTLPVRLALLVAGTTLPMIVFAVGIAFYHYKQDRTDATRRGGTHIGW